jgi:hypothetical protein
MTEKYEKEITAEELLAELHKEWERRIDAEPEIDNTYTTKEIMEKTGWTRKNTLTFMKQMAADGLAEPDLVTRKDFWGRNVSGIPAIRLLTET